ncbi:TPA: phage head-binding domain-containing protein, partial [Providencia alcalifaciens]
MSNIVPNIVISMPSQQFTLARKFQAASNGKIYIGKIDSDPTLPQNQVQVYLENEDGSTIPVAQPIIINQAGYPVYNGQIAKFVTVEGHSMAVYDSYGAQQFYYPNVLKYDPDQFDKRFREELKSSSGSGLSGFSHDVQYAPATVGHKLKNSVWVTDAPFNAKMDGVSD